MFELFVLGTARIDGAGGRLTGEPAQRHRIALLARLASARDATMPRETLMALLWPEQGTREARHLLNVTVHVLRKALGDDVLRTEGDDLRLDTTLLASDVVRFRSALANGDLTKAVESYGGRFLDGFFLGADEFERWQANERTKLEGEYMLALEQLAEQSEKADAWTTAVQIWSTLSARAPHSERVAVRLMLALEAVGDRGGALRVAESHTALLSDEFGAEPSPEVTALAVRMRDTPAAARTSSEQATIAARGKVPNARRALSRARMFWGGVGTAVALTSVIAFALGPWRNVEEPSVAVLPFLDLSPGRDRAYLSDGLTEELLNALTRIPGLRVASRSSSFQFREPGVDVREVGRRLGVAAVVEGSVRLDSNRLRVTAQLIDTRRGYHLWSEQYNRSVADVFAVQEDIARTVAASLGNELVVPDTLVSRGTDSPQAYDLYLRGRHDWNSRTTEGMWRALSLFQEATAIDPQYASAYAGLSDTWQLLPDYGNVPARQGLAMAKTAALRAIALDSSLAAGYASLGAILDDYDHDRAGAERAYRRAISLNPKYATSRQWLAIHLADEARHVEAAEEIERARRIDPLSRVINTAVGAVRYFARDYTAAIAEYRAVLDQAPDFALAWALMGRVYLVQSVIDSAVTSLRRAVELSGGDPSYRAVYAAALAASGQRAAAESVARSVIDAQPGYVPYCEL
ncbi:MAG TPA: BTAD domain-containing putative transcriptional regulator, partial [Gemmatimonadaceae bacterium]|nr:BTAD domain-containing putative transcriptional regulator [Gemmatimonadaceae bacterium]